MFGNNRKLKPSKGDGEFLDVVSVFPTFQGEGPHIGVGAVFVRLGGCNLACTFCDTEFDEFQSQKCEDILKTVLKLSLNEKGERVRCLVVITGGEPLRQNIAPLCAALLDLHFSVQIETNGTLWRPLPDAVDIVCSPKNTGSGYKPLRADLLERVTAIKFIISATMPGYTDVAEVGQSAYKLPVYLQPMDEYDPEKNAANYRRALELAEIRQNCLIGVQLHKIYNIA